VNKACTAALPNDAAAVRIWLDNERPAPRGWRRARTPQEAIDLLETGKATILSLDFDLKLKNDRGADWNGEHVVRWIEEKQFRGEDVVLSQIQIHSTNVVGIPQLRRALEALRRRNPDRWAWIMSPNGSVLRQVG
jgi:hypothetical protein